MFQDAWARDEALIWLEQGKCLLTEGPWFYPRLSGLFRNVPTVPILVGEHDLQRLMAKQAAKQKCSRPMVQTRSSTYVNKATRAVETRQAELAGAGSVRLYSKKMRKPFPLSTANSAEDSSKVAGAEGARRGGSGTAKPSVRQDGRRPPRRLELVAQIRSAENRRKNRYKSGQIEFSVRRDIYLALNEVPMQHTTE